MIGEKFRVTRWNKRFRSNGIVAALHTLSLAVLYLDEQMGEVLERLKTAYSKESIIEEVGEEVFNCLVEEGLLVPDSTNDRDVLIRLREGLVSDIRLNIMYLLLTDGCNLKCRYCFEDTPSVHDFKERVMSLETVEQALRFFGRLASRYGRKDSKKIVHMYGGEPLLNQKALRRAMECADPLKDQGILPQETEFVVVTNGVLMTKDLAEFFAKHRVSVGISIDGPRALNNLHRIAKKRGVDVFSSAKRAYDIARSAGVSVGLSATLTPEVVDNFDAVLSFFVDDLGIQDGVSFNILHYNPAVGVDDRYFERAAECLIRAFCLFREKGIHEERMMRKVNAFVNQEPMLADCGVIGNQVVIAPDGTVGVCQDFVKPRTYFQGSVYNEGYDPVEQGLFESWKRRSPLFMEQCFDCEAVAMCGGGCPASVELKTGDRWNTDERICPHSKRSLEWLIWESYRASA